MLKHAIVKLRLNKSTLNPDDLNVLERVVVAMFNQHFESQDLLPRHQSAYRAIYSIETAITAVYDEIVRAVDSGDMCVLVVLDLSSAFDTVDHDTLRAVLSRRFRLSGIGGGTIEAPRRVPHLNLAP